MLVNSRFSTIANLSPNWLGIPNTLLEHYTDYTVRSVSLLRLAETESGIQNSRYGSLLITVTSNAVLSCLRIENILSGCPLGDRIRNPSEAVRCANNGISRYDF